jgi:hypothetical protein
MPVTFDQPAHQIIVDGINVGTLGNVVQFDGTSETVDDPSGRQTTNGTYDATLAALDGLKFVIVEIQGGGGGGGANETPAAGEDYYAGAGCGGAGGGYVRVMIQASDLGSETVTVGAGGTGGAGTPTASDAGDAGGSSSFGSHATANGGAGGGATSISTGLSFSNAGGAGGTGSITTGDGYVLEGGDGHVAFRAGNTSWANNTTAGMAGQGGDSVMGKGGEAPIDNNGPTNGQPGNGFGGGGGGGACCRLTTSVGNVGGGAGSVGKVVVWEYF